MGTKSKSAGTQHTPLGMTQGVTLVSHETGLPFDSLIDGNNVRRLAVDADINIDSATINVDLDASNDNVAIRNSTNLNELLLHSDGSISTRLHDSSGTPFSVGNPLPVSIIGSLDVSVDHANDSIKVGDGTEFLEINSDGSVNATINNDLANPVPISFGTGVSLPAGTNELGLVKITSNGSTVANIDEKNNSLLVTNLSNQEINSGNHFFLKGWLDINGEGTEAQFLISAPNTQKLIHIIWLLSAESEFTIEVFEGTTTSDDGTAFTPQNNNRNSLTSPGLSIFSSPIVTLTGTSIYSGKIGSGKQIGGESRLDFNVILKQDTKYLVNVTKNSSGTNWLDYFLNWFEYTDLV